MEDVDDHPPVTGTIDEVDRVEFPRLTTRHELGPSEVAS